MSPKENIDDEFWNRADAHINLANEQSDAIGIGKVSASLLYAASRFNAFVAASQAPDAESFESSKEDALEYFTEQFRKMLGENIDDYVKNFDEYIDRDA